jgi:hypothetical protein
VISDEQSIAEYVKTRDGDRLGEVFQRHVPRVRAMVFQLVLDDHLADDVTQEVFLRAWRSLDRFRGRSKFSTWLYRIAVNTARDALADRRRDSSRMRMPRDDARFAAAACGRRRCGAVPGAGRRPMARARNGGRSGLDNGAPDKSGLETRRGDP